MRLEPRKILSSDAWIGAFPALAALLAYLWTLSPFVTGEDGGELAAAAATLGIAHPTGYPLFTMAGWVFAHLPLGGGVLWRLNAMTALCAAAAVYFFYRVFLRLLADRALFPSRAAADPASDRLAAAVGALALAFSRLIWAEAVSLEVYALHLLMIAVVTLLFLRALSRPASRGPWLGFAFALGLSFSNHMMTVLLAPAFLFLYVSVHGGGRAAWIRIARAVPAFLLGLTPYLYLPLRAARGPVMNWGDPSTAERFWEHVTAAQYRFKMFTSPEAALAKLERFAGAFPSQFGWVSLVLGVAGLWMLFRGSRRLFWFSLLLFAACLFYAANYDFDDPNFYLQAHVIAAAWMAFGARAILIRGRAAGLLGPARVACALLALLPFVLNARAANERGNHVVEDYARNVLGSLDQGALIFTDADTYFTSQAEYLQRVEGLRPDVVVADVNLLASAWYFRQLQSRDPGLGRGLPPEILAVLREGAGKGSGDGAVPDEVIRRLAAGAYETRPVYVMSATENRHTAEFRKVPAGLAFRLFRDTPPPPGPPRRFSFRPMPKDDARTAEIRMFYAGAYVNQGFYRMQWGDTAGAVALFREALTVKPGYPPLLELISRFGSR